MNDIEFLQELSQLVAHRGISEHLVDTIAFATEVASRLEDDPVFGDFELSEFEGVGSRGRTLKLHGFTRYDDSDGSIGLVISKWDPLERTETLPTQAVNQMFSWLENFVNESIEKSLYLNIAESNPAYEISYLLGVERSKVNRVRLHLFSNRSLSSKFKEDASTDISGIPIERHIWDLDRLAAIYQSDRERESLELRVSEFGAPGIPCLEASSTVHLTSYLCVIPGDLLANFFDRYGSRLLEGNVRSFLGMKGGVNKGIRATIQDSPELFFAYNNGIAATASSVAIEESLGQRIITRITDLQIVNGGQTTASILSSRKKDKLSLAGVSVPMKLTRVDVSGAQELIPKIAEYANTQNKIAAADFFANHPFHIKMEEISRRLLTPAKAGKRIQSKWFYERSRGQYQNARLYLTTSQKASFEQEYPSDNVINKTQLAKLDNAWNEKPQWVSRGAQKSFSKFADQFDSSKSELSEKEFWDSISQKYGESYYRNIVSLEILWKSMESAVDAAKNTWYQGGYRVNIVTYALAKLFNLSRKTGMEVDLASIWSKQESPADLIAFLDALAQRIQDILITPPSGIKNVGEWCKSDRCWELVRDNVTFDLSPIGKYLIEKAEFRQQLTEGKRQAIQDNGIGLQMSILELTKRRYWTELLESPFGTALTPPERDLVSRASTMAGFSRISNPKDWERLIKIKYAIESEGFRHSSE